MPRMSPSVFAKALSKADFRPEPVYLVYGSEPRRVADAAARLKDKILPSAGGDNYFRYTRLGDGVDDPTAGDIVAALNTVSMFGGGKLVWLGPLESVKKDDAKTLTEYVKNPAPGSTLILTFAAPKGDRKALAAFEKTRLAKEAEAAWPVVRFTPPRGDEIFRWAEGRLRARGAAIDRPALERLMELCGRDLDRLSGEVEKLSNYADDSAKISLDDVETAVGDHREDKLWDLTRAFRQRGRKAAAAALSNLLGQNLPSQLILKVLTTELLRMAAAGSLRGRGEPFEAFAAAAGGPVFPLREAWADCGKWPREDILDGLRRIMAANMTILVKGAPPETVLAGLVAEMTGARRR
ncbi:MAG: DNA polymerase III subunit delta [Candidatus Nitrospinota bacterium M3_3B_026]